MGIIEPTYDGRNVLFNPLNQPILFEQPRLTSSLSAWTGHIPFAFFLIEVCKPRVFVELGTHSGVSYCAFCQAVEQSHTNTKCFAVDTWQGDIQTNAHEYGQNVLDTLRQHHDPLYSSFSQLVQGTFDEALPQFAAGSLSLLHIDGLHTYEAVKHDFETWLPKMEKDGIILFHDIAVEKESFGVKRFWNEIKKDYAHFEFYHCNGLGVLALTENPPSLLGEMFHASPEESNRLRTLFRGLGNSLMEEEYTKLRGDHRIIVNSRTWKTISAVRKLIHAAPIVPE